MADVKISALPAASTPLAGTELVPIVQSGVTEQVTVANLTAGRTVAAAIVNVDANSASAAVRITQTGAGNALTVEDSTNPDATPFVVDTDGNLLLGHTTAFASPINASFKDKLQLNSVNGYGSSIDLTSWSTGTDTGSSIHLLRSDSGVIGTQTAIGSADVMGNIRFWGSDGTTFIEGAKITAAADGTTGTNDMPTSLRFSTTADGAATTTERMRITNAGNIGIGVTSPVNRLQISGSFGRGAPVTKTGDFTLAATENWLICNGTGTITVTFPAASSWTGREVIIKTIAAQTVVSASSNVVPLAGGAAGTAILAASAGAWATLVSDGTNWVIMQA